jgi:hypothetical protein
MTSNGSAGFKRTWGERHSVKHVIERIQNALNPATAKRPDCIVYDKDGNIVAKIDGETRKRTTIDGSTELRPTSDRRAAPPAVPRRLR